jgi:hypothetical protein
VLELTPPLTITVLEIQKALRILDEVFLDLTLGQIDKTVSSAFAGW